MISRGEYDDSSVNSDDDSILLPPLIDRSEADWYGWDSDSDDDAPNMEPFDPILAQNVEFRKQLHPVRYIPYKAGKKVDKNLFKFDNQLFFILRRWPIY